jgi:hypothetical protein
MFSIDEEWQKHHQITQYILSGDVTALDKCRKYQTNFKKSSCLTKTTCHCVIRIGNVCVEWFLRHNNTNIAYYMYILTAKW